MILSLVEVFTASITGDVFTFHPSSPRDYFLALGAGVVPVTGLLVRREREVMSYFLVGDA